MGEEREEDKKKEEAVVDKLSLKTTHVPPYVKERVVEL
jgi:hypothetical protein